MSKSKKPNCLRQIEDCMNSGNYHVNESGELVFTHSDKFTQSEIEMLKIWFQKKTDAIRTEASR